MKFIRKSLLFLGVIFLFVTQITPRTVSAVNPDPIYVSTGTENSTAGHGTKNSPYLSLSYAISKAPQGSELILLTDILYRMDNQDVLQLTKILSSMATAIA